MSGQVKYLVQVNCQPAPVGYENRLAESLGRSFNVQNCHSTRAGVNLELVSGHPLAYGAFKDLADAVEQALAGLDCRLLSGVINRVDRSPLGAAVESLVEGLPGGAKGGMRKLLMDGPLARVFGLKRLAPMLYFYKGDFVYLHEVGGLSWAAST